MFGFAMLFVSMAQAAQVVAISNQEVSIPVNAELGTILELPGAVKTVTPSKYFSISELGASAESHADVRTFQVKPSLNAHAESVTFVLAGGKSVALRLTPAVEADKFYEIHLENKRTVLSQKFLGQELPLMRAMVLDESGGFVREVLDSKYTKLGKFEYQPVRTYASDTLAGYVFKLRNNTSSVQAVAASSFTSHQAILAQVDKDKVEPCPLFKTTPACVAIVRIVVRGPKQTEPQLLANPNAPYAKKEGVTP